METTLNKHLEAYSTEGLRTLVIAERVIPEEEYQEWDKEFKAAQLELEDRQDKGVYVWCMCVRSLCPFPLASSLPWSLSLPVFFLLPPSRTLVIAKRVLPLRRMASMPLFARHHPMKTDTERARKRRTVALDTQNGIQAHIRILVVLALHSGCRFREDRV